MLVLSEVALEKGMFQATVAGLKGLLLSQVLLMCSAVGQLSSLAGAVSSWLC